MRQVGEVIDLSCDDEDLKFELMEDSIRYMAENFGRSSQPNKVATEINQYIKGRTGCVDAYLAQKELSNEIALSIMDRVKEILKANDCLESRVKMSIIGNILDFGVYDISTDFKGLIESKLDDGLAINDIDEFEDALKSHDSLLYLTDNTGEVVFDRLLIERIRDYGVDVTVAVKESPVVNDACMKEAVEAGLDEVADIVTLGCDSGGIVCEMFSSEFREVFDESRFIVSKGMANYEGLTEMDLGEKDVFALLCSKCNPISKDLGVEIGSFVLKRI
jgi:hypothetical protein